MDRMERIGSQFCRLVEIMEKLRGENGCPWDREQTYKSLRQFLLEETYEVLEVIDSGNYAELSNELGDLLLQIIFQSQIAREEGLFDIEHVLDNIIKKLIHRHPNVFGNVEIKNAQEQIVNWEKMKKKEGKKSVIDGVPKEMSALLRAFRTQSKASTVGFDWPDAVQVWEKIHEEIEELKEAIASSETKKIEEEFGDVLFSFVNLARFIHVNPEDALRNTIHKFTTRFQKIETELRARGKETSEWNLAEMDEIWEKAK